MLTPEERAAKIVRDIVTDLTGRRGLRHEWEQIDPDADRTLDGNRTRVLGVKSRGPNR